MGFLADIVHDSRRETAPRSPQAPSHFAVLPVADGMLATVSAPVANTAKKIREAGSRTVDETRKARSAGPGVRKVVSPSTSEHTAPEAALPGMSDSGFSFPISVTREQARGTEAGVFQGKATVLHDGESNASASLGAIDFTVRESVSEPRAALSTAKMTAETQRRRQTGFTTPPDEMTGVVPLGPSSPGGNDLTVESMARPADGLIPKMAAPPVEGGRASSVRLPDSHATETEIGANPRPNANEEGQASAGFEGETSTEDRDPLEDEVCFLSAPAAQVAKCENELQPVPRLQPERRTQVRPSGDMARPSLGSPDGRVHIGTVEVVVVMQPPARAQQRTQDPPAADLASRHYLRNL